MPALADLHDLFTNLLKDIYYAEKKILKALPKMAKAVNKNSPDLAKAFEKHREETEGQIERLEEVFSILGKKPVGKKCDAIEGITKEADELMSEVENKDTLAAGLLAGAQAVEHYEIARYGTLIEWARLLQLDEAADLLQETLDEEKNTDDKLTELAMDQINQAALDAMSEDEESDEEDEDSYRHRNSKSRRQAA